MYCQHMLNGKNQEENTDFNRFDGSEKRTPNYRSPSDPQHWEAMRMWRITVPSLRVLSGTAIMPIENPL